MDFSFVFPCLNEEESLGFCVKELRKSLEDSNCKYEIILADNGSTDNSVEIAEELGCRVVNIRNKGYGAALKGGIETANGEYVIFADCDGSYPLKDTLKLYRKTFSEEADLGIALRLKGKIEHGAMPVLHKYLGTPVLTFLINILFGGNLSDCNSGFRCVKKSTFKTWNIRANGMEFASEMLIKSLKSYSKIVEVPSGLRKDIRKRPPHLSTWRDGMRHLLFILSEKPKIMEVPGFALIILTSIFQIVALLSGPSKIMETNVFDYHTHALLLMAGIIGAQLYLLSCFIYLAGVDSPLQITRKILEMDEAFLFFLLTSVMTASFLAVLFIVFVWASRNFGNLSVINPFLVMLHFISISGFLSIGLLGIHIFKKAMK